MERTLADILMSGTAQFYELLNHIEDFDPLMYFIYCGIGNHFFSE